MFFVDDHRGVLCYNDCMENFASHPKGTASAQAKTSGKPLLWGILLFVFGLVIGVIAVWFYPISSPMPEAMESPTPTPTEEPMRPEAMSGWELFTNTAYGWSIQYPTGLQSPQSLCGGMAVAPGPAEECYHVSLTSQLAVLTSVPVGGWNDSVDIAVIDAEGLDAQAYAAAVLKDAVIHEPLRADSLGSVQGYRVVFSRGLFLDAHQGGGRLHDAETVIFLAPMNGGKMLRLTYPLTFCSTYRYSEEFDQIMSFQSECYADHRVELYEMIADTLSLQ